LRAYVSTGSSNEVAVIDTVLRRPVSDPIAVPGYPSRMVLAPAGTTNEKNRELLFVLCRLSKSVAIINRRSNNIEATIQAGESPTDLAITSDGAFVYVVSPEERRLRRINVGTRQVDRSVSLPEDFEPVSVAVRNFRQAPVGTDGAFKHAVMVLSRKPALTSTVKVARLLAYNVDSGNIQTSGQLLDAAVGRDPQQPSRVVIWEDAAGTSAFAYSVDAGNGSYMSVRDLSSWQPGVLNVVNETVVLPPGVTGGVGGIAVDALGWRYLAYPDSFGIYAIAPGASTGNFVALSPSGSFQPTNLTVNGDGSELWAVSPGKGRVVAWNLLPTGGLTEQAGSVQYSLLSGAAPVPDDVVLAPGLGR
jgi:hypothetical protein